MNISLDNWTSFELTELSNVLTRHADASGFSAMLELRAVHTPPSLDNIHGGVRIDCGVYSAAPAVDVELTPKQTLLLTQWLGVEDLMRSPGCVHQFFPQMLNGVIRNAITTKLLNDMPNVGLADLLAKQTAMSGLATSALPVVSATAAASTTAPLQLLPAGGRGFETYVIIKDDEIKIGRSMNIRGRLSNLQTNCSTRLEVLFIFDKDYEKAFHHALSAHRKDAGEWFHWNEQTEAYLTSMANQLGARQAYYGTPQYKPLFNIKPRRRQSNR